MVNESFNEEMAWRHLQDLQREMENHRLVDGGGPVLRWWLPKLARRVWIVAGLAGRRPPLLATGATRSFLEQIGQFSTSRLWRQKVGTGPVYEPLHNPRRAPEGARPVTTF